MSDLNTDAIASTTGSKPRTSTRKAAPDEEPQNSLNAVSGPREEPPKKRSNTLHAMCDAWCLDGVEKLREHFEDAGYPIPDQLRVGFGVMASGRKAKHKSETWPASASKDHVNDIWISPDVVEPVQVLTLICDACVHAALPDGIGHGTRFKKAAIAVGLMGQMRNPVASPLLRELLEKIAAKLGPLPRGQLDLLSKTLERTDRPAKPEGSPKKQRARQHKASCVADTEAGPCGYTIRIARKWADSLGAVCPRHGMMAVDIPPAAAPDAEPEEPSEGV